MYYLIVVPPGGPGGVSPGLGPVRGPKAGGARQEGGEGEGRPPGGRSTVVWNSVVWCGKK